MFKISDLNVGQRIGLELLWGFACLISVLPYWVKFYLLEPLLYLLLCYVLRYRRRVVMENLRNSFPERSERELKRLARASYHNLAEVFVGTMNMALMWPRKRRRYVQCPDLECVNRATEGRDFIVLMAHYGLWEIGIHWNSEAPRHVTLGVYHQLRSKVVDLFYQRLRTHAHAVPVQKKELLRFYVKHRAEGLEGRRMVFGLIADQYPKHRENPHWFDFLHQKTSFYEGGEQLALRFGMPVWFANFERVGRGRYVIHLDELYDGSEQVAQHTITERYVCLLEQMILADPGNWVWSHRRWKELPPEMQQAQASLKADTEPNE